LLSPSSEIIIFYKEKDAASVPTGACALYCGTEWSWPGMTSSLSCQWLSSWSFSVQSVVSLFGSSEVTFLSVCLFGVPGHFPVTGAGHFLKYRVSSGLRWQVTSRFQWRGPSHFSRVPVSSGFRWRVSFGLQCRVRSSSTSGCLRGLSYERHFQLAYIVVSSSLIGWLTNVSSLSQPSDWSNWCKSIPQELSQTDMVLSCQEATHSNYVLKLYKPCHLLHKNLLVLLVYLCNYVVVYQWSYVAVLTEIFGRLNSKQCGIVRRNHSNVNMNLAVNSWPLQVNPYPSQALT